MLRHLLIENYKESIWCFRNWQILKSIFYLKIDGLFLHGKGVKQTLQHWKRRINLPCIFFSSKLSSSCLNNLMKCLSLNFWITKNLTFSKITNIAHIMTFFLHKQVISTSFDPSKQSLNYPTTHKTSTGIFFTQPTLFL